MKKNKWVVILLLPGEFALAQAVPRSTPSPVPAPPAAEETRLTLDQAGALEVTLDSSVAHALKESTIVLKAKNDVTLTGEQALQNYAQFLPSLSGVAAYTYTNGNNYYTQSVPTLVTSENNGASYSISSTLNIFNGLADISALHSALKKEEASGLSLKRAKQRISLDVAQSFLQAVLDKQIVNIAIENLNRSRARERLLDEQTRIGVKSLADLYRQQAQTSSDESFYTSSENKLRADQVFLLQKLRFDVAKNYHFVDPAIAEPTRGEAKFENEPRLIQTALANRVDLQAANLYSDAAENDVSVVKANYLPQLNLGAMLGSASRILTNQIVNGNNLLPASQTDQWSQLQNQVNYSIGLTLSWTFFDRLITPLNVQRAKIVADNLSIDAQDRRLAVEGEIRRSFGDYQTAVEQLRSSKRGLASAQKAYEVVQGRYDVGSANFVDLTTAQTTLVQAQSARAQAPIGFMLQTRSLEYALGQTPTD